MPLVGGGLQRCTSHHILFVLIGRRNGCLLVVELPLLRTRYVRYLMTLWCMFFHESLDGGFWNF
jgi:hypothetical protein